MEIQKLLMLLAVSWLCCDARQNWPHHIWHESRLNNLLLPRWYMKDVLEKPLNATNTSVTISLSLLCATPVDDYVSIESWVFMASTPCLKKLYQVI